MSNLLQMVRCKPSALERENTQPLILEFEVDPQAAPYLVSSTSGLMWIKEPFAGEGSDYIIRAAVRRGTKHGDLFWECTKAIWDKSLELEWGSAQPYSEMGLERALEHVRSYGMGKMEILVGPALKGFSRESWMEEQRLECPLRVTSWLPERCAVVVPADRHFVGMIVRLTPNTVALSVHNPSRGVAICWSPAVEGK